MVWYTPNRLTTCGSDIKTISKCQFSHENVNAVSYVSPYYTTSDLGIVSKISKNIFKTIIIHFYYFKFFLIVKFIILNDNCVLFCWF